MHIFNITQSIKKDTLNGLGGVDFTKYTLTAILQHHTVRIKNWRNSAPVFLPNMHCLLVKVLCKFDQNQTEAM